jgi:hypothetical protein
MVVLNNCCCCGLKNGVLFLGWLGVIGSVFILLQYTINDEKNKSMEEFDRHIQAALQIKPEMDMPFPFNDYKVKRINGYVRVIDKNTMKETICESSVSKCLVDQLGTPNGAWVVFNLIMQFSTSILLLIGVTKVCFMSLT